MPTTGSTALPPWHRSTAVDPTPAPDAPRPRRRWTSMVVVLLAVLVAVAVVAVWDPGPTASQAPATLAVFLVAVGLWVGTRLDDTLVALGAAVALVVVGSLDRETLFASLGSDTVWLLVAAFVLAAGVSSTGLTTRVAAALIVRSGTVRGLAHRVTVAVVLTAVAVPSTSGRAALLVPVLRALGTALPGRTRVVRALSLLMPTVVLLSAIGTLVGAGAHLVTEQVLAQTVGRTIGFGHWLLLGMPLAVLSAHLSTELVLRTMTSAVDRARPVRLSITDLAAAVDTPITGPLSAAERRAAVLLGAVVVAWCTEPLHGVHPALTALVGALLITAPVLGTTTLGPALRGVPWSLLMFMAATAAMGSALVGSGAATALAGALFAPLRNAVVFLVVVVAVSVAAHLVLQSRTARSSVLVPLVVPAAVAFGLDPVAVAFASTAAAGFCHTLTSSAKPVALFADLDGVPTFDRGDLLRLSVWLAPLLVALIVLFALVIWPLLGLPLVPGRIS